MAQIENSSAGVYKLRTALNSQIERLKQTKLSVDKQVVDIHGTWADHQYDIFKSNFDEGTKEVDKLFKCMEEFDKKLTILQEKLAYYEKLKQKNVYSK